MFGQEMMAQHDANTTLARATPDLVGDRLFATPAVEATSQRMRIEEAQGCSLPAGHRRTAHHHPDEQAVSWVCRFGWSADSDCISSHGVLLSATDYDRAGYRALTTSSRRSSASARR